MSLTMVLAASVLMAQGRSLTVNVSFRDRTAMASGTMLVVRLERSGMGDREGRPGGWRDERGMGSPDDQRGEPGNGQDWRGMGRGGAMPSELADLSLISEVRMMLRGESSPITVSVPYSYDNEMGTSGYSLRAMLMRNGQVIMGSDRSVPVRLMRTNRAYTVNLTGSTVVSWSKGTRDMPSRDDATNWQMADLRGTTWEVTEVDGRQVGWSERKPSVTFDENGTEIRGFSGVNGFGATYSGDANSLRLTMGMHTMMAGNDAQMDVENRLFRVLPTVSRVTRTGQGLTLWANDRAVVRLQRARS